MVLSTASFNTLPHPPNADLSSPPLLTCIMVLSTASSSLLMVSYMEGSALGRG